MGQTDNKVVPAQHKIRVFRWYFYIALGQFLLYFIVPAILFPSRFIKNIEIISALTLGLLVGAFFLLVNVLGMFLDRTRRILHISMLSLIAVYFLWAVVSWAFIEHMDYLLR